VAKIAVLIRITIMTSDLASASPSVFFAPGPTRLAEIDGLGGAGFQVEFTIPIKPDLRTRRASNEGCGIRAANIAEGYARATTKDYLHFVAIAKGSLMETGTVVMLAVRLTYLTEDQAKPAMDLITEISKLLGKRLSLLPKS
jgi:hypothetical protein